MYCHCTTADVSRLTGRCSTHHPAGTTRTEPNGGEKSSTASGLITGNRCRSSGSSSGLRTCLSWLASGTFLALEISSAWHRAAVLLAYYISSGVSAAEPSPPSSTGKAPAALASLLGGTAAPAVHTRLRLRTQAASPQLAGILGRPEIHHGFVLNFSGGTTEWKALEKTCPLLPPHPGVAVEMLCVGLATGEWRGRMYCQHGGTLSWATNP